MLAGFFGRIRSTFGYYLVFHNYVGFRMVLLSALSFVTTLTEGLGIGLFFALLNQLADAHGASSFGRGRVSQVLEVFGLPRTSTTLVGVVILVFVMRGLLVLIQNGYQFRIYMRLYALLTRDLVDAFSRMRYTTFLEKNSGYYTHLMSKEVDRCLNAFYQMAALLPKVVAVLTYLVLAMRFSWEFTGFSVVFGGALIALFRGVNRLTRTTAAGMSRSESQLMAELIQFTHSFKYLQASGAGQKMRNRVVRSAKDLAWYGSRIGRLNAIIPAVSEPLLVTFVSACVYYQMAFRGAQMASLLVVVAFLFRMMREFTTIQVLWQTLLGLSNGIERVLGEVRSMRSSEELSGGRELLAIKKGIRFERVSFQYGSRSVLRDVSFDIPAGSMVAFIGESGSGKTTLVDLLVGLLSPQSGQILYDGIPGSDLNRRSLRERMGYVTQEGVVFEDTVANNVTLGESSDEEQIWQALQGANAAEFVRQSPQGLSQPVGERGVRLSGGQRQRLFLARELFKKPTLLILDEATSNLDSESEAQVQKVIEAWKGKVTVVIVAHRLSTVRNCDQIFVLDQGRIVERGDFNDLVAKPGLFRRMYDLQAVQA